MRKFLLLLLWCLFQISGFGQANSEKSRYEIFSFYFDQGDEYRDAGRNTEAITSYLKSFEYVKSKRRKSTVYFNVGICFREEGDHDKQIDYMIKSYEFHKKDKDVLIMIAQAYMSKGDYESAIKYYQAYGKEVPGNGRGKAGVLSAKTAIKWQDDPPSAKVELVKELSSIRSDFSLSFMNVKKTKLIMASNRGFSGRGFNPTLYYSDLENGKWSRPRALSIGETNLSRVGPSCYSANRSIVFFTKCVGMGVKADACDIYYAFMSGAMKGNVKSTGLRNGEAINIAHPSYSDELNTLFFVSNKDQINNYDDSYTDIWYAKYNPENDTWEEPVRMGPEVNSVEDEQFPYIHSNGDLYFSSVGHLGLGGFDIFVSRKIGDMKWGKAENLRSPINSTEDDHGIIFKPGNSTGYFASARGGGLGSTDIYSFLLTKDKTNSEDFSDYVNDPDETPVEVTASENQETYETLNTIFSNEKLLACPGNDEMFELKIFPNPNDGEFEWRFKTNREGTYKVRIYDISGQVLFSDQIATSNGVISDKMNLSSYGRGAYYLQVMNETKVIVCDKIITQ